MILQEACCAVWASRLVVEVVEGGCLSDYCRTIRLKHLACRRQDMRRAMGDVAPDAAVETCAERGLPPNEGEGGARLRPWQSRTGRMVGVSGLVRDRTNTCTCDGTYPRRGKDSLVLHEVKFLLPIINTAGVSISSAMMPSSQVSDPTTPELPDHRGPKALSPQSSKLYRTMWRLSWRSHADDKNPDIKFCS